MKRLVMIGVVSIGLMFASIVVAEDGPSACVNVRFGEIVLLGKMEEGRLRQELFATVAIANSSSAPVKFIATHRDGRYFLSYGMEAKIEFKAPSDSDWQQTVGAGRDGWEVKDRLVVDVSKTEAAYISWSPGLLVNYPADTQFRIGVVDTKQHVYWSSAFRLHDGVQRLRVE